MALADDFRQQAINWKVVNAQAEKQAVEQKINSLADQVQALISTSGALYIHIPNSGQTVDTYKAIITRWGTRYLESMGFVVSHSMENAFIWWGNPQQVDAEVEAILNPPPEGAE